MFKKIKQFTHSERFKYFVLMAIFALAVVVRLYKIGNPIADWHSWRQADTASVTNIYLKNGINLLTPRYHDISSIQTGIFNPNGYRMVELPIYNAVSAVFAKSFPVFTPEVWGRLVTIFTAVITGFFLYLIAKRILGESGGILAAFFYLFIPYNIYFTRTILPDPTGVVFCVISIWAFMKFVSEEKDLYMIMSAVFFSLAMLIKPYLAFYLVPIAYMTVNKFGIKKILSDQKLKTRILIFGFIAFFPFLLYRYWESRFPEGIPFYKWAFNGSGIRFKPSFWYWIFGQRLSHLILGGLGVIPFVFGVLNTKLKDKTISFALLGALVYVVLVASANVMHDYYQIPVVPIIALALASGSVFMWNQTIFNKTLTRITLCLSVLVMLITGWNLVKENYNINHPEIIEAGKAVDEMTPKDAQILAPYNGDTAFLYQTKRSGWPAVDDSIDNIILNGADYYASVDLGSPDTKMVMARFKTVVRTDKYIIIDLHQPVISK